MNKKIMIVSVGLFQIALMAFVWSQGVDYANHVNHQSNKEKYSRIARMTFLYSCNDKINTLAPLLHPMQDLVLRADCKQKGDMLSKRIYEGATEISTGDDVMFLDGSLAPLFSNPDRQEAKDVEPFFEEKSSDMVI